MHANAYGCIQLLQMSLANGEGGGTIKKKHKGGKPMFRGYTQKTVDFLWGIRFNNERGWFMDHKEEYQTQLLQPTKELADEVATYDYPEAMKTTFVSYWTEPNKSRTRVRYQMEKTWDTSRRLALWASRDKVGKAAKPTEIGRTEFSHNYNETW